MGKQIKVSVSTGWTNGDHEDYWELPDDWGTYSEEEKEKFLFECGQEYLHEKCEGGAEVVDE